MDVKAAATDAAKEPRVSIQEIMRKKESGSYKPLCRCKLISIEQLTIRHSATKVDVKNNECVQTT